MIGQILGHYRILEKLGAGGMGEVYVAEDVDLERRVALKVLPAQMAGSQERLDRFRREAKTLASLNHPNIVTIYSVERVEAVHFLTMELLDGTTLLDAIPRHGLSLEGFFRVAIPLADALAAAHEKGIIHRDLKPGNVFLTASDTVKILDFGLAKVMSPVVQGVDSDAPTDPLTGEDRVLGTIPYMSPEQLKGLPIDHRSDIFSLGIILYQLATGDRPFRGTTSVEVQSSILRDHPEPIDLRKREMPHHLGRIVGTCLEKDPDNRWQSAKDLRNQLQALEQEISTADLEGPAGLVPRPANSSGWRLIALVAVVALVVVIALLAGTGWLPPGRDEEKSVVGEQAQGLLDQGHLFELRGVSEENLSAAEDRYRRALRLEPDSPVIQGRLAAVLSQLHASYPEPEHPPEIRSLAEAALETDPDNAGAWLALGNLALAEGEMAVAEQAARKVIHLAPDSFSGYTLLGGLLVRGGRIDEGLVELRKGVELAGSDIRARLLLAYYLWQQGRSNEAAAEYEAVLRYAPDSPEALNNLGIIYGQQGRYLDALPMFRRLLQLGDDAEAAMNLANCYFYLDRLEEALAAYHKTLEIDPDHDFAAHGLGETYEKLGEPEQARLWFEKAVESYSRQLERSAASSRTLALRAVCHAKLGDIGAAVGDLNHAERLDPDSPSLLFNAAQVHALGGNREAMLDYVGRTIQAGYPRHEIARDLAFRAYQDDEDFRALLESDLRP